MTATFLLLFAGAIAVLGWLLTQSLFFLGQRKRDQLQHRLTTGGASAAAAANASAFRPIPLPKEEDNLRALLAQKKILGEFTRRLGQAYPGVTIARFVLIEMIVVLGSFAAVGLLTQSFALG